MGKPSSISIHRDYSALPTKTRRWSHPDGWDVKPEVPEGSGFERHLLIPDPR